MRRFGRSSGGGEDSKVGTASLRSFLPLVPMVQPADPGQLNHLTTFRWLKLDVAFTWSVFREAIMGSVVMIVVKIG